MNKKDQKTLASIVKRYEEGDKPIVSRPWFNLVLWLVVCFSIFALLQYDLNKIISIIISIVIGASVMLSFMLQASEETLRIIKPCFSIKYAKEILKNT